MSLHTAPVPVVAPGTPTPLSPGRARLALLALALGGFGIGATEFVAMGLLPQIAADLLPVQWAAAQNEALAQAGWLISAYALGVVVGAPTIAAFAARLPQRTLLMAFLGSFTVMTVLSAALPTFGLVLAARFVAALAHGAYFGVAALVAARIMGPGRRAQGVAIVMAGLTISNVIGVPTITLLGQQTGWRQAYLVVALIFALAFVAVRVFVPWQAGDPSATIGRELGALRRPLVWFALATGALGFGGFFAVYTYVAPMVTEVAGLPEFAVSAVLVVFGVGQTVGNFVGGWAADRFRVLRVLFLCFAGFGVALTFVALAMPLPGGIFVGVLLVGLAGGAIGPVIQTRLMDVAGDSQTLAAAANHSALNIGNSLGAWLGGVTIAAGLGYASPPWVGLALCGVGAAIAAAGVVVARRTPVVG